MVRRRMSARFRSLPIHVAPKSPFQQPYDLPGPQIPDVVRNAKMLQGLSQPSSKLPMGRLNECHTKASLGECQPDIRNERHVVIARAL